MQIYVQNCVLSLLEIPGLLDRQFTNAEFQSSCSETGRSLHPWPCLCLTEYLLQVAQKRTMRFDRGWRALEVPEVFLC